MRLQEDYQITLERFHGPMDLLLYLIRRAEVDVTDIPISKIADQYLAMLRGLDDIDIDLAGEFLVMAASLVELKSRVLAPPPEPGDGDADAPAEISRADDPADPRFELVQALLAYQRFRIASEELDLRRSEFAQRFARKPARQRFTDDEFDAAELELEDLHILDLADAYESIIAAIDFTRIGDHHIEMDDTPLVLHQEDLIDRLERRDDGRLTLQQAFEGATRVQRIGLFLATLELVRLRRVTVVQDDINTPIELVMIEDADEALVIEADAINAHEFHYHDDQTSDTDTA